MSFDITGLDKLQRDLDEAQRTITSLNGTIATLEFDPNNPASVEEAVRQMENAVDRRVSSYGHNALVSRVARGAKEQFRRQILERANSER